MRNEETRVELIYDHDCPNIGDARTNLVSGLVLAGWPLKWTEWNQGDPHTPERARQFGSPTILVDGADIAGGQGFRDGRFCRIYGCADHGVQGVPQADLIAKALLQRTRPVACWLRMAAPLPSLGIALLPKLACPACWPAYAGLLSSVGLGFLTSSPNLLGVTAGCLGLALGAIAFQAFARKQSGPLVLAAIAAAGIVLGKFVLNSGIALYLSAGAFMCASIWHAWPVRTKAAAGWRECVKFTRSEALEKAK